MQCFLPQKISDFPLRLHKKENFSFNRNQSPRDSNFYFGLWFFYPTFSNNITLHRFCCNGSGGSMASLTVAVSMKPLLFSAAPLCVSLVMCIYVSRVNPTLLCPNLLDSAFHIYTVGEGHSNQSMPKLTEAENGRRS